jgi:GTP cyclohydrolase I
MNPQEAPAASPPELGVEDLIRRLLLEIGEDPERDGLMKTPGRVARSYEFLTGGYKQNAKDVLNGAIFESDGYNELVLVKDIDFYSLCEHHMLPFFGKAHVAYLPRKHIVGLSKLARLVEMFSRRLQVQERMTQEIAEALQEHLDPLGVGVILEGYHLCMMMRGIQKQNSRAVTSAMRGSMLSDSRTRGEFLQLVGVHIQD